MATVRKLSATRPRPWQVWWVPPAGRRRPTTRTFRLKQDADTFAVKVEDAKRRGLDAYDRFLVEYGLVASVERQGPTLSLSEFFPRFLDAPRNYPLAPKTRREYEKLFRNFIEPLLGQRPLDGISRANVISLHREAPDQGREGIPDRARLPPAQGHPRVRRRRRAHSPQPRSDAQGSGAEEGVHEGPGADVRRARSPDPGGFGWGPGDDHVDGLVRTADRGGRRPEGAPRRPRRPDGNYRGSLLRRPGRADEDPEEPRRPHAEAGGGGAHPPSPGKLPEAYVFTSPEGQQVRPDNWRSRVFQKAAQRAGLQRISPHDLRRTARSLAETAGASPEEARAMGGWSSYDISVHYLRVYADRLRAVADRFDEEMEKAEQRGH